MSSRELTWVEAALVVRKKVVVNNFADINKTQRLTGGSTLNSL